MRSRELCPTCGTTLGPLQDKDTLQRCSSCSRVNPRGFLYCGYCAAPMESDEHRAELAEVAAPPGGWPSLTRELIEVRFFLDRGELDEAFERIAVLREHYPGHPELVEFQRGPKEGRPRPDTQVNRVVDSVLSSSSSLGEALPRRAAPQWKAPAAGKGAAQEEGRTQAHETVTPVSGGKGRATVRKKVVRSSAERNAGSFPSVAGAPDAVGVESTEKAMVPPPAAAAAPAPSPAAKPEPRRLKTDKHAGAAPVPRPGATPVDRALAELAAEGSAKPKAETAAEAAAAAVAELDAEEPTAPRASPAEVSAEVSVELDMEDSIPPTHTVAVPTLQPPAPYRDPNTEEGTPPVTRSRGGVRKRALKARKRSGAQPKVGEGATEDQPRRRRVRGHRFGQHVLGRLGGKGDD